MTQLAHTAEPLADQSFAPDVSVVLAAWNEGDNIGPLIRRIQKVLGELGLSFEVIVVDGGSKDKTVERAEAAGAEVLLQKRIGYGGAVREGFARAKGRYVLTMDCDLSHPPELAKTIWENRDKADIIIGSRFVSGGDSEAPLLRRWLSVVLNIIFSRFLAVPIKDSSSGYRLYKRDALVPDQYTQENFNILQEILVTAFSRGFSVAEVPLRYEERKAGSSHVSLVKFCLSYLPTLYRLWLLRNSTEAADYDSRAWNSRHFLQRYWQRKRYALVKGYLGASEPVIDLGCGSSRLVQDHPRFVAADLALHKLRFLARSNKRRVQMKLASLPFADASASQLLCSQVLQYEPKSDAVFAELNRVLAVGGTLVVAVPDNARISWRFIGWFYRNLLPNVYRGAELSSYGRGELIDFLARNGFRTHRYSYICGAELVLRATKVE
jgi:glycosyltransferase involved in cell wall biosynthesis